MRGGAGTLDEVVDDDAVAPVQRGPVVGGPALGEQPFPDPGAHGVRPFLFAVEVGTEAAGKQAKPVAQRSEWPERIGRAGLVPAVGPGGDPGQHRVIARCEVGEDRVHAMGAPEGQQVQRRAAPDVDHIGRAEALHRGAGVLPQRQQIGPVQRGEGGAETPDVVGIVSAAVGTKVTSGSATPMNSRRRRSMGVGASSSAIEKPPLRVRRSGHPCVQPTIIDRAVVESGVNGRSERKPMRSPITDYLTEALDGVRDDDSGELAGYIPELASADPGRLAAVFATADGETYSAGDAEVAFTIQSISKPFVYALAIADRGLDAVLEKVGVEPSGDAFNELSLEDDTGRPLNPMINAGAIAAHTLAGKKGLDPAARLARIVDGLSAFVGRRLEVDEAVFSSEMETANRNLAFAYMLRSHDILEEDPVAVVEGYTRQCSLLVTTADLAVMAATLANRGVQPVTGEQVVPAPVVRQVLSVMSTCGMYDAAGDWATQVGIPAKSGVAGGLIGALPGQLGIATFSPRLDRHGNSVRGVSLFERFSTDMGMHLMEVSAPGLEVVRSNRVLGEGDDAVRVIELQGGIRFSGAERAVREAIETAVDTPNVAFDLTLVHSVDDAARRMLLEVVRRLTLDGREVFLVDPERIIDDPEPGDGGRVTVVESVGQLPGQS